MDITGRKLFVKALQEEGVTTLFGYPGGTVTDLFDELYKQDGIEVVLPRHEQGLIHEAEGYARSVSYTHLDVMKVSATKNVRNKKMQEIRTLFCDDKGRMKRNKEFFEKNSYIKDAYFFVSSIICLLYTS